MQIMYQNNNYIVYANEDRSMYEVVNRTSTFLEFDAKELPKAIASAEVFSDAIDRAFQKQKEKSNVVDLRSPR